ncbi:MAG: pantetheine-phosphate adenylyltransferase [bacterium]|nr:pantetheine-phosphate adenylyltransferase [bacterium]
MRTALFPGSFDPVTNGHLDVIERASKLFDKLIISVAINESKNALFTMDERKELLRLSCKEKGITNLEIKNFDGLLVDAVQKFNACVVIRGLRAVSDFEFEFQMALMNRELNHLCETVFLMPSPEYSFTSSRMIKEIAKYKGDISAFVPSIVMDALNRKELLAK